MIILVGREINNIAQEIGYDRDVVRVWFCNKRQSLKHCQSFQRSRIILKSSDSTEEIRNSTSPALTWAWTMSLPRSFQKFLVII